jgi:hypothetical protein
MRFFPDRPGARISRSCPHPRRVGERPEGAKLAQERDERPELPSCRACLGVHGLAAVDLGTILPQLLRGAGWTALVLTVAGGLLYSLGAIAYGLRRPDPCPRWFGFHEVFHACTVAAFACQYVAVWIVAGRAA